MGQLGFFDSGLLETILLARAVGYDLLMLDGKYIAAGSSPRSLMWPERQCRKSHRFAASRLSVTLLILSIACDAESHLAGPYRKSDWPGQCGPKIYALVRCHAHRARQFAPQHIQ
jgi:hypothetical protein